MFKKKAIISIAAFIGLTGCADNNYYSVIGVSGMPSSQSGTAGIISTQGGALGGNPTSGGVAGTPTVVGTAGTNLSLNTLQGGAAGVITNLVSGGAAGNGLISIAGAAGGPPCNGLCKSLCSAETNTCVECLTSKDCTKASASVCDDLSHTCRPCSQSRDCQYIEEKHVCSPDNGGCVQCTKTELEACPDATMCSKYTCTTETKASAGLCQTCVSDEQCLAGQACVEEAVGLAQTLTGHFVCLWKKGDTTIGAPTNCSDPDNQPYTITRTDALTIDGAAATVCGLSISTCAAWIEGLDSTINCAPDGIPEHSLCVESFTTTKCLQTRTGKYQCSPSCSKNSDCLNVVSRCLVSSGEQACQL